MSYSKIERYFPAGAGAAGALGAIDISDASDTTEYTWVTKTPCIIYGFGGLVTEAMGTQTTTVGVGSMTISTEKSTITSTPSAAIGTETLGTQFAPVKCAAGTSIVFKNKTQAVGGTVVGEWAPFVMVEFFHNLAPA